MSLKANKTQADMANGKLGLTRGNGDLSQPRIHFKVGDVKSYTQTKNYHRSKGRKKSKERTKKNKENIVRPDKRLV